MNNMEFNIKSAHRMVSEQRKAGNDVRWDGWDIVFFRASDAGRQAKDGAFRNGQWGFDNRFVVNSKGIWSIDSRNIKRLRRSRS